ncbi:MAG TPA: c-type cytochrome, partial [Thiolinea sp.]|nr:c-type cytochrome [Thiolinea sp.]
TVDKTIAPKVRSGQEIFAATCTACHTSGVLGAPKLDQADWTARIGNGLQGLMNSALQGKGQMPARGGNPSLTDEEVQAAVNYMLDQAGVKLAN